MVWRCSNWRRINPNFEGGVPKWTFTLDSRILNNETAYNYGYVGTKDSGAKIYAAWARDAI